MRLVVAMDRCEGKMRRDGMTDETVRAYRRYWELFGDMLGREALITDPTYDDCCQFVDRYISKSASTQCAVISAMRKLFAFVEKDRGDNPMDGIDRPKRRHPEEHFRGEVSVETEQVELMLAACETWQEFLCLTTALYMGSRRHAIAMVRRQDVDLEHGTMLFEEKNNKFLRKPIADEYLEILVAADAAGVWDSPLDYLVPNRRPNAVRNKVRSDKVIWDTVKIVAERALGNRELCHVHALRAAFAVAFYRKDPQRIRAIKEMLGHSRLDTTLIYLRRADKAADMEAVRDLSWGGGLEVASGYRPLRLRPIRDSNPCYQPTGLTPRKDGGGRGSVPFSVSAKLDELAARANRSRVD